MLRFFLLFVLLAPTWLLAIELRPWYLRDLEPHSKIAWDAHLYDHVDAENGPYDRSDFGQFAIFGIDGSYTPWAAEIEMVMAHTRDQHFGFDHASITGRYQWYSDDVGDPMALTTGITLIQAVKQSVRDITSFHHSTLEGEGHIAIGKQRICEEFWTSRWWVVGALGLSDQGSPWLRGNAVFEKNYWNAMQWQVFLRTLWGLGGQNLDLAKKFRGYGPIHHQSVDLGGRFCYWTDNYGELSVEYAYRVYAKNFPEQMHEIKLQLLYPIAL